MWIVTIVYVVTLFVFIKNELDKNSVNPLTKSKYLLVWLLCLFNPIISGAAFYLAWRKKMLLKATQATRVSFLAIGFWVIGFLTLVLLLQKNIISIPNDEISKSNKEITKNAEKVNNTVDDEMKSFNFFGKEFVFSSNPEEDNNYVKNFTRKETLGKDLSEIENVDLLEYFSLRIAKDSDSNTTESVAKGLYAGYQERDFLTKQQDYISKGNKNFKIVAAAVLDKQNLDSSNHVTMVEMLDVVYFDAQNNLKVLSYLKPQIIDISQYKEKSDHFFDQEVNEYMKSIENISAFNI